MRMRDTFVNYYLRFSLAGVILLACAVAGAAPIYVKHDATGAGTGDSWADAYTEVQAAITSAAAKVALGGSGEIWIAGGEYVNNGGNNARLASINSDGIILRGGYAGSGSTRDIALYETVLDGNGDMSINHGVAEITGADNVVLEGLTLTRGFRFINGAGLYIENSGPNVSIEQCKIKDNAQYRSGANDYQGGGIYILDSEVDFTTCTISNNSMIHNRPDASGSDVGGGGFYAESSVVNFVNCEMKGNTVENNGTVTCYARGGLGYVFSSDVSFLRCDIIDNQASVLEDQPSYCYGGALYSNSAGALSLTDCVVSGNSVNGSTSGDDLQRLCGGAIFAYGVVDMTNCLVENNGAYFTGAGSRGGEVLGGAIYADNDLTMSNCIVRDNRAECVGASGDGRIEGGAIYFIDGGSLIDASQIYGNIARWTGGGSAKRVYGGAFYMKDPLTVTISNSIICNNDALPNSAGTSVRGGAFVIIADGPQVTFRDCVISGHLSRRSGAGYIGANDSTRFVNCVITGNTSIDIFGGFAHLSNSDAHVINCSFFENNGGDGWGTISAGSSAPLIINSIFAKDDGGRALCEQNDTGGFVLINNLFYNNAISDIFDDNASGGQDYSGAEAINLNVDGAFGNIDGDPLFAMGEAGNWDPTDAVAPNAEGTRTVLTDSSASWTEGELVGKIIKPGALPGANYPRHHLITSNTATRVQVVGDCSAWVDNGDAYQIIDLAPAYPSKAIDQGVDSYAGASIPSDDIAPVPRTADAAGIDNASSTYDIGAYEFSSPAPVYLPASPLDFGTTITQLTGFSPIQTLVFGNAGTHDYVFASGGIALDDTTHFSIRNSPSLANLAPGTSVTIDLAFDPTISGDPLQTYLRVTPSAALDLPDTQIILQGVGENNVAPAFSGTVISKADAKPLEEYAVKNQTLADDVSDPNTSDALLFAPLSDFSGPGPDWLDMTDDGALSGIPVEGNLGTNTWTVSVSDLAGETAMATLQINVLLTPPAAGIANWNRY